MRRARSETFMLAHGHDATTEEQARMDRLAGDALDDPLQMVETLELNGDVCGYYWLRGLDTPAPFLVDLHILHAYRRNGLGAVCLSRALDRAGAAGAALIELSVARRNVAALALYRSHGSRVVSEAGDAFLLTIPVAG